jgi:hypothetical protein
MVIDGINFSSRLTLPKGYPEGGGAGREYYLLLSKRCTNNNSGTQQIFSNHQNYLKKIRHSIPKKKNQDGDVRLAR